MRKRRNPDLKSAGRFLKESASVWTRTLELIWSVWVSKRLLIKSFMKAIKAARLMQDEREMPVGV